MSSLFVLDADTLYAFAPSPDPVKVRYAALTPFSSVPMARVSRQTPN